MPAAWMSEGQCSYVAVHCPLFVLGDEARSAEEAYMPRTSSVKLSGTILRSGENFALTT